MTSASKKTLDKKSALKTILLSGFVAGALDILGAFLVYSVIMKKAVPSQILRGIAAGIFGKRVVGTETVTALIGLLFHFIIAFSFAAEYFLVYPDVKFLHRNKMVSGLLYGIIVWAIMNFIVIPLSNVPSPDVYHAPFAWMSALRAVMILMICFGLPVSIITARYYKRHANR
jgi:uncharacterized membrane protein YagU involved in acid resistance